MTTMDLVNRLGEIYIDGNDEEYFEFKNMIKVLVKHGLVNQNVFEIIADREDAWYQEEYGKRVG